MDIDDLINKAKSFVESSSDKSVEYYSKWGSWFAFIDAAGKITVVFWDVFRQIFVFRKPSTKTRRLLQIH